jgi:hypothetical protein
MRKIYFSLCIIALLFLTTCRKKVEKEHPEYIGEWYQAFSGKGCVTTLDIDSSSLGHYRRSSCETKDSKTGIVRVNDRKLKIGTKGFIIIEPPTAISPITFFYHSNVIPDTLRTKMVLKETWLYLPDEVTLYKIENP